MPPQGGRKHPHQEFLTIDTTNVLFICGGAFAGLEKIIERRDRPPGRGLRGRHRHASSATSATIFSKVLPEDLLNYGLIPEFIGRLPVISAVHYLDRDDAGAHPDRAQERAGRQYQKFFSLDEIELVFADDALEAIADKAHERETGARGLRSIIEEALLNVMFELPSRRRRAQVRDHQGDDREGPAADPRHRSHRSAWQEAEGSGVAP